MKNIHLSFCKNIRLRYLNREKEDETKKRGYETYECLYMNLKLSNSPFSIIQDVYKRQDIGIKENGLVHLSQLAERFISDPTEVVSIHQQVMVKVMSVDNERKRIQLTMIGVEQS